MLLHCHADGCAIQLASGRTLTARAVVYCASACVPVRPAWAEAAQCDSNAARIPNGATAAQPHAGPPAHAPDGQQLVTSLFQLAAEMDLRTAPLAGRSVAVVGGGMTAAQLALGALEAGAQHVMLVSRHALRAQPLDCEVGAQQALSLNGFTDTVSGRHPIQRMLVLSVPH